MLAVLDRRRLFDALGGRFWPDGVAKPGSDWLDAPPERGDVRLFFGPGVGGAAGFPVAIPPLFHV